LKEANKKGESIKLSPIIFKLNYVLASISPITLEIALLCTSTEDVALLALLRYSPTFITRTAARITMMAITRTISISVKPFLDF